MKGRAGFIELIDDVQSRGFRPYSGLRHQPLGRVSGCRCESACYEFICKIDGVKVAYGAEQFDNDGSLLSISPRTSNR
jgi:hypothetical protein